MRETVAYDLFSTLWILDIQSKIFAMHKQMETEIVRYEVYGKSVHKIVSNCSENCIPFDWEIVLAKKIEEHWEILFCGSKSIYVCSYMIIVIYMAITENGNEKPNRTKIRLKYFDVLAFDLVCYCVCFSFWMSFENLECAMLLIPSNILIE